MDAADQVSVTESNLLNPIPFEKKNDADYNTVLRSTIIFIFYFTPINQTRYPGTQRRVLQTFMGLTGISSAAKISVVTTMWDLIWGESARNRAKRNYQQLEDDIWKDFIAEGAQILKFHNKGQASALSTLDNAFDSIVDAAENQRDSNIEQFQVENMVMGSRRLQDMPFGKHLRKDLQDRVQQLRLQFDYFQSLLADGVSNQENKLPVIEQTLLQQNLDEVKKSLAILEQEIIDFEGLGLRPQLAATEASAMVDESQHNQSASSISNLKLPPTEPDVIRTSEASPISLPSQKPSIRPSSPLADPVPYDPSSTPAPSAPPFAHVGERGTAPISVRRKIERLGQAVHSISFKCCGDSVLKNHDN
ncbi:hypothetical protein CVT24_001598 [Panaeolus cyanescens]|uniref:Uncharacterized protein n=1 Tax=Panaeolus cyanescens TaxID=181874 RepID=A0A409YFC7_9AGAR|nr:hypothetical protein CVT24_001598 [Panaeolus cyanescens]